MAVVDYHSSQLGNTSGGSHEATLPGTILVDENQTFLCTANACNMSAIVYHRIQHTLRYQICLISLF